MHAPHLAYPADIALFWRPTGAAAANFAAAIGIITTKTIATGANNIIITAGPMP